MTATTRNRRVEPEPQRDWSSKPGAEALAADIRRFWASFGYADIVVWVEAKRGGKDPLWIVRSRLLGGLPPRSHAA
jgi:hypothetical protein